MVGFGRAGVLSLECVWECAFVFRGVSTPGIIGYTSKCMSNSNPSSNIVLDVFAAHTFACLDLYKALDWVNVRVAMTGASLSDLDVAVFDESIGGACLVMILVTMMQVLLHASMSRSVSHQRE